MKIRSFFITDVLQVEADEKSFVGKNTCNLHRTVISKENVSSFEISAKVSNTSFYQMSYNTVA